MTARRALARLCLLATMAACNDRGNITAPVDLTGSYSLVSENGQSLPSDPVAPFGCCLTLSGSLTLVDDRYELRTSHRNKNNGLMFDNSESGRFIRAGNEIQFVRTGGGGIGYPYLLAPALVEGTTVSILYGDEGPGSNQIRAVFRR